MAETNSSMVQRIAMMQDYDLYRDLVDDPRVMRVLALSGGYTRAEACERLARNHGVIASFSRALTEGLKKKRRIPEPILTDWVRSPAFQAAQAELTRQAVHEGSEADALHDPGDRVPRLVVDGRRRRDQRQRVHRQPGALRWHLHRPGLRPLQLRHVRL